MKSIEALEKEYNGTIDFLYNQLPVFQKIGAEAYKPGLGNTIKLDTLFGQPHKAYKTIHVGGTNGKGSTSHTLAAILQESGYTVGLYTSPHLVDFRERIRVNGIQIDKQYIIDFVANNKNEIDNSSYSFFELTMMMSFCYFRDMQVDMAVIEVGLGGRLDSTNIINPILSIITNIGLDHTQFLGNTIKDIAKEKAGIIKPNVPCIIGESNENTRAIFLQKANESNSPIIFAEENPLIKESKLINNKWHYSTPGLENIEGELGGLAQIKNANTILHAIDILKKEGVKITNTAIYEGFKNVTHLTGLMGRWQIIQKSPMVVCDTGHNKEGIEYIVKQLEIEEYDNLHIIIGFAKDKDIDHILELLPKDATYYFVAAKIDRALPALELKQKAEKHNLNGIVYSSITEAYEIAKKESKETDFIFIGGSNFVVGEFLENNNPTDK